MPRYAGLKTYGKGAPTDTMASKRFDEVFNPPPDVAKVQSWRIASGKEQKVDVASAADVFSFDSDDDGPASPKRRRANVEMTTALKSIESNKNQAPPELVCETVKPSAAASPEPIMESPPVLKRGPIRTYTRIPKTTITTSGNSGTSKTFFTAKITTEPKKESFTFKLPVGNMQRELTQVKRPDSAKPKKFFTTKNRVPLKATIVSATLTTKPKSEITLLSPASSIRLSDNLTLTSSPMSSNRISMSSSSPIMLSASPISLSSSPIPLSSSPIMVESDHDTDHNIDSSDEEISFKKVPMKGYGSKIWDSDEEAKDNNESLDGGVMSPNAASTSVVEEEHAYTKKVQDQDFASPSALEHSYTKQPPLETEDVKSNDVATASTSRPPTRTLLFNRDNRDKKDSGKARRWKLNTDSRKNGSSSSGSKDSSGSKRIFNSPKKSPSKAVYNPRPWSMGKSSSEPFDGEEVDERPAPVLKKSVADTFSVADFDEEPPTLTRAVTWPQRLGDVAISSLKVHKEHRPLYTVVRNVKEAHECLEHGETQEFKDEVEYLLDGLKDSLGLPIRCLSTMSLAQKCTNAAFRMHLRAHGIPSKVFSASHDACQHPGLALATACFLYMMCQDRLSMDLDRDSLDLMVRLLSVDRKMQTSPGQNKVAESKEYDKAMEKVKALLEEEQQKTGAAQKIDLNNISTGILALESLLTLTNKRAGELFKEELRTLGGLDHIADTVIDGVDELILDDFSLDDEETVAMPPSHLERLCRIDRCLRVLENVTYLNKENQEYLISYKKSTLTPCLARTLKYCEDNIRRHPVEERVLGPDKVEVDKESDGYLIFSCVLAILRVLLNLTHDYQWGSQKVGEAPGLLKTVLMTILHVPQYVPSNQRFDVHVLGLGVLINSVEHCDVNRKLVMNCETYGPYDGPLHNKRMDATRALTVLFCQREAAAQRVEDEEAQEEAENEKNKKDQDESGVWKESDSGLEWVMNPADEEKEKAAEETNNALEDEGANFTKALHKAGIHMEDSIVASYVALLLGTIIQDNQDSVERVREHLPSGNFEGMSQMLTKFLGFMNLTAAIGSTGGKSIARVIRILEAC